MLCSTWSQQINKLPSPRCFNKLCFLRANIWGGKLIIHVTMIPNLIPNATMILNLIMVLICVVLSFVLIFSSNQNCKNRTPLMTTCGLSCLWHKCNVQLDTNIQIWKKYNYAVVIFLPLLSSSPCAADLSLHVTALHIFVLQPCSLHKIVF